MNRRCLIRGLGIAWSVGCGILCVLLIVLWVRSHTSSAFVVAPFFKRGSMLFKSSRGRLTYGFQSGRLLSNGVSGSHWGVHFNSLDDWQSSVHQLPADQHSSGP